MSNEVQIKSLGLWSAALAARHCTSCMAAPALLYCRADDAFLCGACDACVHTANSLSARHERVCLCEVCEQAPAAVTCKADAASLCTACDVDIHSANPLARRHDRAPVVPFCQPLPTSLGVSEAKSMDNSFSFEPYLDLDYAVNPFFQIDSVVPVCRSGMSFYFNPEKKIIPDYLSGSGKDSYINSEKKITPGSGYINTEEKITSYLNSVRHTSPVQTFILSDPVGEPEFTKAKPACSSYTTNNSIGYSISSSEAGEVPDAAAEVSNKYGSRAADREARVMRYREKRKNRKFEKTIRYASRKAYAETRPRVKGRFVKRTQIEAEVDKMHSSAAAAAMAFMDDVGGYGVVPSF